jgi:hypothetical protein
MEITQTTQMLTDGEDIIHVDRDESGNITAYGVEVDGATDMRTDNLDEVEAKIKAGLNNGTLRIYR